MARSMSGGSRSGGGGGRSMGSSGRSSRSFSGSGRSSSSSGSHRSLSSSSHSSYSSHSSHSHGSSYHRPYRSGYTSNHYYYGGSGYGPRAPRQYYRGSGGGCSSVFGFVIALFLLLMIMGGISNVKDGTAKSSKDMKLDKIKYTGEVCTDRGYYIDDSTGAEKWIDASNEDELISGMKRFYNMTGVFPFLYVVDSVPGGNETGNINDFIDAKYEELFKNRSGKIIEGNLLIVFIGDIEDYYMVGGLNIGDVIDAQAIQQIKNSINRRWDSGDLGDIIGGGLADAAGSIMAKSISKVATVAIIIVAGVILVIMILFKWWKARVAQKNKEQEDLEKILSTPLQSFGDVQMEDLQKKYREQMAQNANTTVGNNSQNSGQ